MCLVASDKPPIPFPWPMLQVPWPAGHLLLLCAALVCQGAGLPEVFHPRLWRVARAAGASHAAATGTAGGAARQRQQHGQRQRRCGAAGGAARQRQQHGQRQRRCRCRNGIGSRLGRSRGTCLPPARCPAAAGAGTQQAEHGLRAPGKLPTAGGQRNCCSLGQCRLAATANR